MTTNDNTSAPPLDLAAIEARHAAAQWPARMAVHDDGDVTVWEAGGDGVATIAQRRDLWPLDERAVARADSLRHLTADVPALIARVRDLGARVSALQESYEKRGDALFVAMRRAVAAERLLDATEGTEREEELARQIRAEADARVAAARREGADAMREAVVAVLTERARWHEPAPRDESCEAIAAEVRALPLPEAPR